MGPGSKMVGSAWPVPHSESVKVLVPKWKKRAISPSCHESWEAEGRGKMGRGGGLIGGFEMEDAEDFSVSDRGRMGRW